MTAPRRLGPPGPSISDQAREGSLSAQTLEQDVELLTNYVANVVDRLRTAVLYGVDVEVEGPDDTEGTGLRNLTEDDAGALVGVLRTLQQLLANADSAVGVIVGKPPVASIPSSEWPVSL